MKDYDLEVIDANIKNYSEEEVEDILVTKSSDIVLISVISYDYNRNYHRLAEIVKSAQPSCTLIMGGVYVTTCIEHVMEDKNIDIGMMGHAEERLQPLIDAVLNHDTALIERTEGIALEKIMK